ncbi:sulfotransferase [Sinirhodobacter populi]|uniref:Sulfotransferase n=1 Tax=Paenirhodobacter populi TaxID=2306993 RepID=A0A443JYP3_9RHOB|nr:Stf0 family sulfotransferase [Sinirhodobacter populi]RWR25585.1 sulfotransferase [Sinirhodobacter populi]
MAYESYMICTSPRSGSTLLCNMLAETGVAGNPASYFYRPSLEDWTNRLGIKAAAAPERKLIWEIIRAAITKGRGVTPVFGLRQQRPSFGFLCEKLGVAMPEVSTDRERMELAFGRTLFIHLTRGDKLEQAVSLIKAQQTGLWHVATDGSELERTAPDRRPVYDAGEIARHIETLTAYDTGWLSWFDQEGIAPLRITYSELSEAPGETLRMVLSALGLDTRSADSVQPRVRKMADKMSQDWIARYNAETA